MDESVRLSATLKKLKTQKRKWFVLLGPSADAGARIEYYDTEKKFKTGTRAKHPILLQHCINISRRADTKNKLTLLLFTRDDSLGLVFESEEELAAWHKTIIALQTEIGITKQRYDHVWEVSVKEKGLADIKSLTAGAYRMYLTSKNLGFLRLNQEEPDIELYLATIRSCGHADNFFHLEIGSAAITGAAKVWMQVEDTIIAQNMHEIVLSTMKTSGRDNDMRPPTIFRPRSSSSTDKSKRPPSMRRPSTSASDANTLPRRPGGSRHSTIGAMGLSEQAEMGSLKRRSTFATAGSFSLGSSLPPPATLSPPTASHVGSYPSSESSLLGGSVRSRTDSMSSHGSMRTDHSAQSSDVEPEAVNNCHSISTLPRGTRDKTRITRRNHDITVTGTQSEHDLLKSAAKLAASGATYMEMAASTTAPTQHHQQQQAQQGAIGRGLTRSRTSESSDGSGAHTSMGAMAALGTSPANSTSSSCGGAVFAFSNDDAGYCPMAPGGGAISPAPSKLLDGGYMHMAHQNSLARSNSSGLRPERVSSLLSNDSLSGAAEALPPRANSVGSKGSALHREDCSSFEYMDMCATGNASQPINVTGRRSGHDKSLSAPHLEHFNSLLLASSPANVGSTESSRSATPRSTTPSQQLEQDLLMEMDFENRSSRESLSDFHSRTSSGGSRDFYSAGFGSHDIRDRTGSFGSSRNSSLRYSTDGHRPRTSTIGQETLRPRTSSFGTADMRPRAASHGTRFKELSRRVKEKQLRQNTLQEPPLGGASAAAAAKLWTSSKDSIGSGSSSGVGGMKSGSDLLRCPLFTGASNTLPEEEYMLVSPPTAGLPGTIASNPLTTCLSTPPRGTAGVIHHSTPTHEANSNQKPQGQQKHVHLSLDVKPAFFEPLEKSVKRSQSYRGKEKVQGSSSESLSSSSSDMGGTGRAFGVIKSKIRSGANNKKGVQSTSVDTYDYVDASPQGVVKKNTAVEEQDDAYIVFEPGQVSNTGSLFSKDKVVSPIRGGIDDHSALPSSFLIAQSAIKEEDNDALFGPKPNTIIDPKTLDKLKDLKHEYVNVDFENAKNAAKTAGNSSNPNDSANVHNNNTAEGSSAKRDIASVNDVKTDMDTSLGYHSAKEHDYMEIDVSKTSSVESSCDLSKNSPDPGRANSSPVKDEGTDTRSKANGAGNRTSVFSEPHTLAPGQLIASLFHDYCEISFDAKNKGNDGGKNSQVDSIIPDPFGELCPPSPPIERRNANDSLDKKQTPQSKKPTSLSPLPKKDGYVVYGKSASRGLSESSSVKLSPTDSTSTVCSVKERARSGDSHRLSSSPDPFADIFIPDSDSKKAEDRSLNSSQRYSSDSSPVDSKRSNDAMPQPSVSKSSSEFPFGDIFGLGVKPISENSSSADTAWKLPPNDDSLEKTRRVSHGEMNAPLSSTASASLRDVKSTSQSSLTRFGETIPSRLQTHSSSSSLSSLDSTATVVKSGAGGPRLSGGSHCSSPVSAEAPNIQRRSYHESPVGGTTSVNDVSSTADSPAAQQLNYAALDLSASMDESGLSTVVSGTQSPAASGVVAGSVWTGALQRMNSIPSSGVSDIGASPFSYAQIDFEKSEQLRQATEQQRAAGSSDIAPPFDCL